jgi:hypothetical protein
MIRDHYPRSKYAGRVRINDASLDHVITSLIGQQNQIGVQGSLVLLAENDGKLTGFIAGILDRIYLFGAKLKANDVFFVNTGPASDAAKLFDGYVNWARSIRAVEEIRATWTDILPESSKVAKLYARKGFAKTGEIYALAMEAQ